MSKKIKKVLRTLLSHLLYYNRMAPFPVFDTEYVEGIKNKLREVMEDKDKDYDLEPVVACKFCKDLHILSDEIGNDVCMKCGAINELEEFSNINEYLKWKHGKDS